ncbi:hypothetical protein J6590_002355 [Homalodisca vitripennis]|nr:hypothetical protein J6590_002355 [Homalodisca vitripennis]
MPVNCAPTALITTVHFAVTSALCTRWSWRDCANRGILSDSAPTALITTVHFAVTSALCTRWSWRDCANRGILSDSAPTALITTVHFAVTSALCTRWSWRDCVNRGILSDSAPTALITTVHFAVTSALCTRWSWRDCANRGILSDSAPTALITTVHFAVTSALCTRWSWRDCANRGILSDSAPTALITTVHFAVTSALCAKGAGSQQSTSPSPPHCAQGELDHNSPLRRHLRTVHKVELERLREPRHPHLVVIAAPYQCLGCGRRYLWKGSLRQHERFECGQEPRQCCQLCSYKSHTPSHLRRHLRNVHKLALQRGKLSGVKHLPEMIPLSYNN